MRSQKHPPNSNRVLSFPSAQITHYKQTKQKNNNVAIYGAIIDDYDTLLIHEHLNPAFDYICYTNTASKFNYGVVSTKWVDYFHVDKTKMARYIKTHPHWYLNQYDYWIWCDSNIIFSGDMQKYINKLIIEDRDILFLPHPHRQCLYREAEVCRKLKKDDARVITEQVNKYRDLGWPENAGMVETGVFVARNNRKTHAFFNTWWKHICRYSKRDQISALPALENNNIDWGYLIEPPSQVRKHADFKLFTHGIKRYTGVPSNTTFISTPTTYPYIKEKAPEDIIVSAVVCVHNALNYVKRCMDALLAGEGYDIIIVNDNSDIETTHYIHKLVDSNPSRVSALHSTVQCGYVSAANAGVYTTNADFVVLVNSDCEVAPDTIQNLKQTAYSAPWIGFVGPLSNAAGAQSIPYIHKDGNFMLPTGMSKEDLDKACKRQFKQHVVPVGCLIHGFCLGIKREAIEAAGGLFDIEKFKVAYGEENDFCIRANDAGYMGAVCLTSYVYHAKSKSYSNAVENQALKQEAITTLHDLYGKDFITDKTLNIKQHYLLEQVRKWARSNFKVKRNPPEIPLKKSPYKKKILR